MFLKRPEKQTLLEASLIISEIADVPSEVLEAFDLEVKRWVAAWKFDKKKYRDEGWTPERLALRTLLEVCDKIILDSRSNLMGSRPRAIDPLNELGIHMVKVFEHLVALASLKLRDQYDEEFVDELRFRAETYRLHADATEVASTIPRKNRDKRVKSINRETLLWLHSYALNHRLKWNHCSFRVKWDGGYEMKVYSNGRVADRRIAKSNDPETLTSEWRAFIEANTAQIWD